MRPAKPTDLGRDLVRFFEDYLPAQRGVSPHTLRSYRDALLLLLQFVARDSKRPIERLEIADLTPERITRFLSFLESERKNGIATRNARLGAIHVFARFMASHHPEQLGSLQRIIGLPFKRGAQEAPIEYLERAEIEALLNSIDRTTHAGSPRLCAVRADVQHGRAGSGGAGPASPRRAPRCTVPGAPARQGKQGPTMSDLAGDRALVARADAGESARSSQIRQRRSCSPMSTGAR